HVEPALSSDHRGKQPDRPGTGDQQSLRRPDPRTATDPFGMIPGLGHDTCRLDQNAVKPERRIELDQKARLDPKKLPTVARPHLDAAFGVAAIAAHVPFAGGAGRAGNRIRTADDADDKVATLEAGIGRSVFHRAQRFVANDEPLAAWRRPAIQAGDNLAIGPANAERQAAHQYRAVLWRRVPGIFHGG